MPFSRFSTPDNNEQKSEEENYASANTNIICNLKKSWQYVTQCGSNRESFCDKEPAEDDPIVLSEKLNLKFPCCC